MQKNFGKHLILDVFGVKENRLQDKKAIENLLKDLPGKFKMRPLGNPVVEKIASDLYPTWGLSGFTILYESHISLHTWPEKNYVAMDIYSCRNFNAKPVIKYLTDYWQTKKLKVQIIVRASEY